MRWKRPIGRGFEVRRSAARAKGKYLGIGLAMYLEQCGGGGGSGVDVEFHADGTAVVYASQQDNGQAHRTTLTQIFSHQLGYDADKIKIVQGDSQRTPRGTTGGARMAAVLGSTLSQAADIIADKAKPFAAEQLDAARKISSLPRVFSALLAQTVRLKSKRWLRCWLLMCLLSIPLTSNMNIPPRAPAIPMAVILLK